MGIGIASLARGRPRVVLHVARTACPSSALVGDARELGRQLARATHGRTGRAAGRAGPPRSCTHDVHKPVVASSPASSRRRRARTVVPPSCAIVAIPAAIALGSIGAIAAERVHLPMVLGFSAARWPQSLTVLALPSLPTRRATVVLLGVGGLGALRHASYSGGSRSHVARALGRRHARRARARRPGRRRDHARARGWYAASAARAGNGAQQRASSRDRDRRGRRARAQRDDAPRPARVARARSHVRRRAGRGDVAALDPSTRHDDAPAAHRQGRVHRRLAALRLLARRDVRRRGTARRGHAATRTKTALLDRDAANNVEVPPALGDVSGQTGNELRQTFHLESDYTDVVFAAPSPRRGRDRQAAARPARRHGCGRGRFVGRLRQGRGVHRDQPRRCRRPRRSCAPPTAARSTRGSSRSTRRRRPSYDAARARPRPADHREPPRRSTRSARSSPGWATTRSTR